jgi:hypothetical protein
MIIDESVAPMRKDPRRDAVFPVDMRPERERLLKLVATSDVRLGRLMALGTWGEAVIAARSARDLRAIALLPWVLDPTVDVDGRKRADRLTQAEFEAKIVAYEKRLEELDEKQILASIGPAKFERHGELLVLDVLEADGTWDLRKSYAMEVALAAVDKFSRIPGARSTPAPAAAAGAAAAAKPAQKEREKEKAPPRRSGPPLTAREVGGRVVLVFPQARWDLDVAAALGKGSWEAVVQPNDDIPRQLQDRMQRDGVGFVAPLEYLSEVFIEGKPLSRPQFEAAATPRANGVRTLEVHCPRFGAALLLDVEGRGRFITSELRAGTDVLALVG